MANENIGGFLTTNMGDYTKHGAEPVVALLPPAPVPPSAPCPAPAPAPSSGTTGTSGTGS